MIATAIEPLGGPWSDAAIQALRGHGTGVEPTKVPECVAVR